MVLKILVFFLCLISLHVNAGGIDSVGGDYIQSSKEQIKSVFNGAGNFDIKESVRETLKSIEFEINQKTLPPRLESIFSVMFGKEYNGDDISIYTDLSESKYELKEKCQVHKIEYKSAKKNSNVIINKSASAILNKKGTAICFDIRVLSRIPLQALPFQFVSLAIHEHAHHYDFDEEDAVLVQNHALKLQAEQILTRRFMDQVSSLAAVRDTSIIIRKMLYSGQSDNAICKYILKLNSAIERVGLLELEAKQSNYLDVIAKLIDFKQVVSVAKLTKMKKLNAKISNLEGFCGIDNYSSLTPNYSNIEVGDKKIMLKEVEELIIQSQEIISGL